MPTLEEIMDPTGQKLQQAAQHADDAFSEQLRRQFGRYASDARYRLRDKFDAETRAAYEEKLFRDAAYLAWFS